MTRKVKWHAQKPLLRTPDQVLKFKTLGNKFLEVGHAEPGGKGTKAERTLILVLSVCLREREW